MRQVPHYLIIGHGNMALHMQHYLQHLGLSYSTWARQKNREADLHLLAQQATHILLLIKDDAIDTFIETYLLSSPAILIHFSGALHSHYAVAAHPLQTFGAAIYVSENYKDIPFIMDDDAPPFETVLPGIPNTHYRIPRTQRVFYHAHCVMANNFTTLLWQHFFNTLEKKFDIDKKHLTPFLKQTLDNLTNNHHQALTGPLAREDDQIIASHINTLIGHPYQPIYKAFVQMFKDSL